MEHEFESELNADRVDLEAKIREAENNLLDEHDSVVDAKLTGENPTIETDKSSAETRLLERGGLGSIPFAEKHTSLGSEEDGITREVDIQREKGTSERQEIHKSPEGMLQNEPAGPRRPSWETPEQSWDPHLVPAHVLQELDDHIANWIAENDSRILERQFTRRDMKILKGDAGEGRTYVDLLTRFDRTRILHQPRFEDFDKIRNPDFAIVSNLDSKMVEEIVDSKAWAILRPKDSHGNLLSDKDFFQYLQAEPQASSLINIGGLRDVVEKYGSSPRLEPDGKVVLYLPEDVFRNAPEVISEIEGWSGSELAFGHPIEVRSMGVWDADLNADVHARLGT